MSGTGYKKVIVPEWENYTDQMCQMGCHHWSVARLIELSRDLEVEELPLRGISLFQKYNISSLQEMVKHFKAVQDADLQFPIILDEDGEIMDGRHWVMKALYLGEPTIKAVRFDANPRPCRVDAE